MIDTSVYLIHKSKKKNENHSAAKPALSYNKNELLFLFVFLATQWDYSEKFSVKIKCQDLLTNIRRFQRNITLPNYSLCFLP